MALSGGLFDFCTTFVRWYRESHISGSFNLGPNKSSAQSWSTPQTSVFWPPPYLLLSGFCSTLIFMHDKAHKSLLTKTVRPTSGLQYPWSSEFSFYCSPAFVEFFMRCFQSTALLWGGKVFIKI